MKNATFLFTTRRIEIINKKLIIKNFFVNDFIVYVFHIRVHNNNVKNFKNVHKFKKAQINVAIQNKKINQKQKIKISKK